MISKNIVLAFLALVVLSGVANAQWNNAVSFSNVTVSPNPVVAGGNMTIRFQLYNSYDYWLYNLNLQPTGTYPLLNVSPLSSRHISPLPSGPNAAYFNYTVAIPAYAPAGTYTLTFEATYYVYTGTGIVVATSSIPVSFYVQNKPTIRILPTSPQPATLYSEHNQTLQLAVENVGYGNARNVSVTVSPGQNINLLSSVTTFFISNLTQGSVVDEPILIAAQNAGNSSLHAAVTYYSTDLKQRYSSVQQVNLSVAQSAQFSINSSNMASAAPGATDVPIKFAVKNTGTSAAQQLQLSLQTSYPVTPIQSSVFVDSLPVGATENVTFMVSIDSSAVPGNYPVTLYEQWKQPNGATNQQFTGSQNYFVAVASTASSSILIIAVVAVVVIAAAGMMIYRRRTAAKKSKK